MAERNGRRQAWWLACAGCTEAVQKAEAQRTAKVSTAVSSGGARAEAGRAQARRPRPLLLVELPPAARPQQLAGSAPGADAAAVATAAAALAPPRRRRQRPAPAAGPWHSGSCRNCGRRFISHRPATCKRGAPRQRQHLSSSAPACHSAWTNPTGVAVLPDKLCAAAAAASPLAVNTAHNWEDVPGDVGPATAGPLPRPRSKLL
jgi:hypothetical protein